MGSESSLKETVERMMYDSMKAALSMKRNDENHEKIDCGELVEVDGEYVPAE